MRKYLTPLIMLAVFETVAVTLWLAKDNIFYLFNFSYIGISISLGIFLFIRENKDILNKNYRCPITDSSYKAKKF